MITKFKIFEKNQIKPDVNSVSSEFWKMVEIADWKSFIEDYTDYRKQEFSYMERLDECRTRIFAKYDYHQIQEFLDEYHELYMEFYDYFHDTWLSPSYSKFMPSDDGYGDLISSIIGLGKDFVENINKKEFVKMAKNDYFAENFGYVFQVDENEYAEVRAKVDPLWGAARKYNL